MNREALTELFLNGLKKVVEDEETAKYLRFPFNVSKLNDAMRALNADYNCRNSPFERFGNLMTAMADAGHVTIEKFQSSLMITGSKHAIDIFNTPLTAEEKAELQAKREAEAKRRAEERAARKAEEAAGTKSDADDGKDSGEAAASDAEQNDNAQDEASGKAENQASGEADKAADDAEKSTEVAPNADVIAGAEGQDDEDQLEAEN